MRRLILLLYSLSPGVAKIASTDAWFGIGLLMLLLYLSAQKVPVANTDKGKLLRYGLLAVAVYSIFLGILLLAVGTVNERTLIVGFVTFITPLAIVAIAGPHRTEMLFYDIPSIALVHVLIALAISPPIQVAIPWIQPIAEPLLNGTMALRLASVSGSLAMSTLMTLSFGVIIRRHFYLIPNSSESRINWLLAVLFFSCGIMTLQRATWVGMFLLITIALITGSGRRTSIFFIMLAALISLSVIINIIQLPDDTTSLLTERFYSIGDGKSGAIAERIDQWANVSHNFNEQPMGYGPGQLGQAVRDTYPVNKGKPIYDGDYFRIISEYGLGGLLLLTLLATTLIRSMRSLVLVIRGYLNPSEAILPTTLFALFLQGIGTNVTEIYFVNTLFWSLVLHQWNSFSPLENKIMPQVK